MMNERMEGWQCIDDKLNMILVMDRAYRDEACSWKSNGKKVAEVFCSTQALSRNL